MKVFSFAKLQFLLDNFYKKKPKKKTIKAAKRSEAKRRGRVRQDSKARQGKGKMVGEGFLCTYVPKCI